MRPPKIDVRALQIFEAVLALGSMTEAAKHLGLTQSAVSQQIGLMEDALSVELFDRTIRPLKLTPAGLVLRESAQRIAEELTALRPKLLLSSQSSLPELRIGIVDSLAWALIPPLVKTLDKKVRNLVMGSGLSIEGVDALLDRRVDIIVTSTAQQDFSLQQFPILQEPYVLVCPTTILKPPASLQELSSKLPFIRYSLRTVTGQHIEQQVRRLRLTIPLHLEFETSEPLVAMVEEGIGWAISTPFCLLQAHVEQRNVAVFKLPQGGFSRLVTLVARAGELGDLPQTIAEECRQAMLETLRAIPAGLEEISRDSIRVFTS